MFSLYNFIQTVMLKLLFKDFLPISHLVCMCVCVYMYVCVCKRVCMCVYIYIYIQYVCTVCMYDTTILECVLRTVSYGLGCNNSLCR